MTANFRSSLVAAALGTAIATGATAGTIDFDKTHANLFGDPPLRDEVRISIDGGDAFRVLAGGFHVTDGTTPIVAWCIDLAEHLDLSVAYDMVASPLSEGVTDMLGQLFDGYAAGIDTGDEAAAFQLAIWELISDGTFDLEAGSFRALSNQPVKDLAESYLAGLSAFDPDAWTLKFFAADGTQDFVTGMPSPVPLPAAGWLLAGAVGALAFGRKRST